MQPEEPREPKKLCGRRFTIREADGKEHEEPDYVYCGLPFPHSGMHVAMVWFWDNDCTPQTPPDVP